MSAPKYFPNWAEKNELNNKRRIPPIDPAFIVQSPPAGSFDIKKQEEKFVSGMAVPLTMVTKFYRIVLFYLYRNDFLL
jgi:hypothetical protein